jgi:hypothetical protein
LDCRDIHWVGDIRFIDGNDFRDIEIDEENNFLRVAKRVEMYTANNAPPQFNDFAGCGSIVIWTY